MTANPILVQSLRGEVVESFHRGVVCVVNERKEIVFSVGDVYQLCYPRSAMKFFQQIPLLALGGVEKFNLTLEEIALLCGSHNGERRHTDTVRKMLEKGGFTEDDLECGAQMPTLSSDKNELIKAGLKPMKIHNNCSGKHTGFLLLCRLLGIDHKNYISPTHPTQKIIAETCSRFYETPLQQSPCGIDGCSAPIYAYTLFQQAVAYQNLINPVGFPEQEQKACKLVVEAVTKHPFMIAGSKRYCTELMEAAGTKVVGKTGADGVYCLAVPHKKWGISIKVDDGKMGVQYAIAQALLAQSGILNEEEARCLENYVCMEIRNFGGLVTGELRVNPEINLDITKA